MRTARTGPTPRSPTLSTVARTRWSVFANVWFRKDSRSPSTASRRAGFAARFSTASIFMFCEPLSGWRAVTVRDRRTKVDWAQEVERLLRTRYAAAEKVVLVCDNLNTHTKGAFYEAFKPEQARCLVRRLDFCHTP